MQRQLQKISATGMFANFESEEETAEIVTMCMKVAGDMDKVLHEVEGEMTGIWLSSGGGSGGSRGGAVVE